MTNTPLLALARLVLGTLSFWLLAGAVGLRWKGPDDVLPSIPAGLLCLLPAMLTLWWSARAAAQSAPETLLVAFLGGTMLRMAIALGGALALYFLVDELRRPAFWVWVALFYLFTLGLETSLALRLLTGQSPQPLPPGSVGGPSSR